MFSKETYFDNSTKSICEEKNRLRARCFRLSAKYAFTLLRSQIFQSLLAVLESDLELLFIAIRHAATIKVATAVASHNDNFCSMRSASRLSSYLA